MGSCYHGRRNLTLNRAIQLAQAIKFDTFDTEYLVILVLRESRYPPVQEYFSRFLQERFVRDRSDYAADSRGIYSDVAAFAVSSYAEGKSRAEASSKASEALFTLPELTQERVDQLLSLLEHEGVLMVDPEGRYYTRERVFVQNEGLGPGADYIHLQYAKSFIAYCEHRLAPATMNSFFKRIPCSRFPEVRDKLLAMRDWLRRLSLEDKDLNREEVRVFQCDINLFPVSRHIDTEPST